MGRVPVLVNFSGSEAPDDPSCVAVIVACLSFIRLLWTGWLVSLCHSWIYYIIMVRSHMSSVVPGNISRNCTSAGWSEVFPNISSVCGLDTSQDKVRWTSASSCLVLFCSVENVRAPKHGGVLSVQQEQKLWQNTDLYRPVINGACRVGCQLTPVSGGDQYPPQ